MNIIKQRRAFTLLASHDLSQGHLVRTIENKTGISKQARKKKEITFFIRHFHTRVLLEAV